MSFQSSQMPPNPRMSQAPSAQLPEEGGFNLELLGRALRKNWFLVVLAVGAFTLGASLYTSRLTRIYQAFATVQLDPQPLMPLGNQLGTQTGPESYWSNQEYFATQHQVLTSRKIAEAVVRKLGLNRDNNFVANTRGAPPTNTEVSVETAAEILRGRLDVKPVADSRLTRVTYQDADPVRAQRITSTLVDEYVEQNLDRTLDSASQRAEWLDTQLVKLKSELESQEMDLHDFKRKNNLLSVSFDDQSNMLRAQIQQLNATLTDLKTRQERVAARLAVLQSVDVSNPSAIPQSELFGDVLGSLRTNYVEAQKELLRLTALGKGENHPDIQAAEVAVVSSRNALMGELDNIRKGCAADLDAVHRELAGVTRLYETAKSQAMDLNINEVRYARLRRSKDNTEHVFGVVLERSTESGLSKLMPFNNVRVLDRPLLPGAPLLPRPALNLALGAAVGLLVGLCFAVGRELLDRTVRDPEDVERELGIPSIGALPDVASRAGLAALYYGRYSQDSDKKKEEPRPDPAVHRIVPELLVHHYPKSAAAEAARAIRTNLMLTSPDRPYKTLLVTSAGPAEGKTMVAASIAIAMSQTGQRVCLVDCDLRRPRVHNLFGSPIEPGVTVAMLDPSRLDDALFKTEAQNLWVLPAGPTPPNPADLMHSEAFGRLISELQSRFDRIVIDSPPACIVTDSVVISTRVDATLLVVRARRTRRDAARRALRALTDVGGAMPGFIMNAVMPTNVGYPYTYYGTYGQDRKKLSDT